MAKLQVSPPWITYYNELREFFKEDMDIKIIYDEEANDISIYVSDPQRAAALEHFIPSEKEFGSVKLNINIIPPNNPNRSKALRPATPTIETALCGNPHVKNIIKTGGPFAATYVIFEREVVQYFDDNLGDYYGNISTLWQNIAKNIFENCSGIFFCTSNSDSTSNINISNPF